MLDRRTLLRTSVQLTLLAPFVRLADAAAEKSSRFVLVILRGALDGLAACAPYGDAQYSNLRGPLALGAPGTEGGVLKLDGTFGLHPSLTNLHALYQARELAVLHAVATPYRERSHFDAQKVLEAGKLSPAATDGGWLNRALAVMHGAGDKRGAVALNDTVPLVLRGEVEVSTWAPSRLPDADEDLLARVRRMYEAVDPPLASKLNEALDARAIAGDAANGKMGGGAQQAVTPLVSAAARFLRSPDGPRIAVIDVGGWDTHANQGGAQGNLATRLKGLDGGIATLKTELGPVWADTTVLVVTEFGRTVAVNGTRGTDHGTAGVAFLAGGHVQGGRVLSDWPGLAARDLYENRDLKPTTDLRGVFKGVLAERFGVPESALERTVFPDSAKVAPLAHLTA
ncbi:MAG TPA: DUF1501 domain-containing protein [Gammaproteobacteria bacterium]|jgi:uncharacterized protein (DUF1501 family)|nr:DUF1501 domain-containing protein [Gammaproteobacteria bacterium]